MPSLSIPKKLKPFLSPKKFKVAYGGRGSGKSMSIAGMLLMRVMTEGARVGCMRENMNSIDDSVHALLVDEIHRLKLEGFTILNNSISHLSGGEIKYKGLARNPESVKSMHGFNYFWVEEAGTLSKRSIDLLVPTLRAEGAELWLTFNPGASADPICQEFLKPFEKKMKGGCYEDGLYTIIKCNYLDNPFFPENLNLLRIKHKETKSRAEYDHVWLGAYADEVEDSIIKPEWFDAAVDAHKVDRLREIFKPVGAKIAAHDPSDSGSDSKGFCLRHGSIIKVVKERDTGEIDEGCDWATGLALKNNADWFIWDGDGMGTGLKRQVSIALDGTRTRYQMFKGSLSGKGQDNAERIYQAEYGDKKSNPKAYKEVFKNNRAQYYIELANRFYNTYRCVERSDYVDPDEMISLDSEGVEDIDALRSEVCRIPRKQNPNGLEQIMNKMEMKKLGIDSPNMSDSLMMALFKPPIKKKRKALNYGKANIV